MEGKGKGKKKRAGSARTTEKRVNLNHSRDLKIERVTWGAQKKRPLTKKKYDRGRPPCGHSTAEGGPKTMPPPSRGEGKNEGKDERRSCTLRGNSKCAGAKRRG